MTTARGWWLWCVLLVAVPQLAAAQDGGVDDDAADAGVDAGAVTAEEDAAPYERGVPSPESGRFVSRCWSVAGPSAHAARLNCLRADPQSDPADLVQAYVLWGLDGSLIGIVSFLLFILGRMLIRFHDAIELETTKSGMESEPAQRMRAFQIILMIPVVLVVVVHFYGITSFVLGYTYIGDVARPALVVAAMMSCGIAVGALFGLPQRFVPATDAGSAQPATGTRETVGFGSRLERIADWLTSAIVGVALTQGHWVFQNWEAITVFFSKASGMIVDRNLGVLLASASFFGGLMFGYLGVQLFMPLWLAAAMQSLRRIEGAPPESVKLLVDPASEPEPASPTKVDG